MGEGQMTPYCKGQCKGGKSYVTRFCDADQQQHMALSICLFVQKKLGHL